MQTGLILRARAESAMWHLPDGEAQQQRDKFIRGNSVIVPKAWDGVSVDEPPEGEFSSLGLVYQVGHDVVGYVSAMA